MVFAGVCLRTTDVLRLADFYKMILKTTSDCNDLIHQEILTNGAALAILRVDDEETRGNKSISLAFTVDSVDAEYERLTQVGINIVEPPTLRPWGAINMMFTDPDGNDIVFRSFPK